MMWIYDEQEKQARYVLPPKKKKRRASEGNSVTTSEPSEKDLDPPATNRQQPWRYGQKRKRG